MKIAIAGVAMECVSFLPDNVGLDVFEANALRGQALLDGYRDTRSVGGGFLSVLDAHDADIVPIFLTEVPPAGPATVKVLGTYIPELQASLRANPDVDGLLLCLHGAMVAVDCLDPETAILEAAREIVGPDLPIGVGFDLHANLSLKTAVLADMVAGYHYSPHIDMFETGARAATMLIGKITGAADPVIAMRKVPIALPSIFTATSLSPLSDIVNDSVDEPNNTPGILDMSVFTGFGYADTPDIGFSIVVMADGDRALAERVADRYVERIAAVREELVHSDLVKGLEDGVRYALDKATDATRPLVILEHADRGNDATWVLQELMKQSADARVYLPFVSDPAAAEAAIAAGPGAVITIPVGGISSPESGGPVTVTAEVLWAGQKTYTVTGPLRTGAETDLGATALLRVGNILISVISTRNVALDLDCFRIFDLSHEDFDIIVLHSKTHFRAVYQPIAEEIVIIDTPDFGRADLASLPFRNVPDGVYPITA